jgi:hypothetical protein
MTREQRIDLLTDTEAEVRLEAAKLNLRRVQAARAVQATHEILDSSEWFQPYVDLLSRFGNEAFTRFGGLGFSSYQAGTLAPLIRTEQDLAILRVPSQICFWTNQYAQALVNGLTCYVVGEGFRYEADVVQEELHPGLKQAYQAIIDEHLNLNEWGAANAGEGEAPSLEADIWQRLMVHGEGILREYPCLEGRTDVRFVEPWQMSRPASGDVVEWSFGVLTERYDAQKPIAYHLRKEPSADGDIVNAEDVIHIRHNVWRTAKRGLPDFCFGLLDTLRLANVLRGNLGDASAQQAAIVGVEQPETGSVSEWASQTNADADIRTTGPFALQERTYKMQERGQWKRIPKGFQYAAGPGAANAPAHLAVLQTLLRTAAVKYNAPEWMTSSDAAAQNFATSLTVDSVFVKSAKGQQKRLRGPLGKSVQRAVERRVYYLGRLTCRAKDPTTGALQERTYRWEDVMRLCKVKVICPDPTSRDPLILAQQREIETRNNVLSPQTWAAETNRDYEHEAQQIEEHRERFGDAGVPLSVPPGFGAPVSGAPAP